MCNCRLIACPLPQGKAKAIAVYSLSHCCEAQLSCRRIASCCILPPCKWHCSSWLTKSPWPSADFGTDQAIQCRTGQKQRQVQEMLCCQLDTNTCQAHRSFLGILEEKNWQEGLVIWESKGDSIGISLISTLSIHHSYTLTLGLRHFLCQVLPGK